jgi:hypothetical protein
VDTLGTDTSVGRLTAELELPLLAVEGALGTSGRSLVARVTRDTHFDLGLVLAPRFSKISHVESVYIKFFGKSLAEKT